ncbi:MAG: hypothetical protein IJ323_05635 [Clostridia bacterium]|nr:hypothetical protein [Clostridia bacterium]
MNVTGVKTNEKVMMTLRLPVDTYWDLLDKVQSMKKEKHGYSINQYLTELIEKDISGKK